MYEYVLSTNEYKKPQVLAGRDAIGAKLIMLLNMVPGTDPLHPEKGIDIKSRYRFATSQDIDTLQEEIDLQIKTYFPKMISSQLFVTVDYDDSTHEILVKVIIDQTLYSFDVDESGAKFTTLNDNDDLPPDTELLPAEENVGENYNLDDII